MFSLNISNVNFSHGRKLFESISKQYAYIVLASLATNMKAECKRIPKLKGRRNAKYCIHCNFQIHFWCRSMGSIIIHMTESARQHDITSSSSYSFSWCILFSPPHILFIPITTFSNVIKFPILTRISFYTGVNVLDALNAIGIFGPDKGRDASEAVSKYRRCAFTICSQ